MSMVATHLEGSCSSSSGGCACLCLHHLLSAGSSSCWAGCGCPSSSGSHSCFSSSEGCGSYYSRCCCWSWCSRSSNPFFCPSKRDRAWDQWHWVASGLSSEFENRQPVNFNFGSTWCKEEAATLLDHGSSRGVIGLDRPRRSFGFKLSGGLDEFTEHFRASTPEDFPPPRVQNSKWVVRRVVPGESQERVTEGIQEAREERIRKQQLQIFPKKGWRHPRVRVRTSGERRRMRQEEIITRERLAQATMNTPRSMLLLLLFLLRRGRE